MTTNSIIDGRCFPKLPDGSACAKVDRLCLSGKCDGDSAICVQRDSNSHGSSNEERTSNRRLNSKRAKPALIYKPLGEACDIDQHIICDLGTICEKNICRFMGTNAFVDYLAKLDAIPEDTLSEAQRATNKLFGLDKYNVVTNATCTNAQGYSQCSTRFAYCDRSDGEVCLAKKPAGEPCRFSKDGKDYDLIDRCRSNRCPYGFCGVSEAGHKGDPCESDDDCKAAGLICRSAHKGALNICNAEVQSGVGQRCNKTKDCHGYLNYCFNGECENTDFINGKSCKTNDDCGGIERKPHGTEYQVLGFTCTDQKCVYHNYFDGYVGVSGFVHGLASSISDLFEPIKHHAVASSPTYGSCSGCENAQTQAGKPA
ncbi:hypothetical protein BDV32DRAFT_153291 [Aspergillus pseudonomiae]|nr:hypothetical protein BDV32DRAFT_153291 [Aspergillus pseudonomiae]